MVSPTHANLENAESFVTTLHKRTGDPEKDIQGRSQSIDRVLSSSSPAANPAGKFESVPIRDSKQE
jgi:hypothetical protein